MGELSNKKPVGNFPNEAAGLADALGNAVQRATESAKAIDREREAALVRCLASPGVPMPEDVDRVRHLYIRLDKRVDGQRELTGGRRETWEAIRGLLVRWEELGAVNVDPILNSRGGGELETWEAIQAWAEKERLRPVAKDAGKVAKPVARKRKRRKREELDTEMTNTMPKKSESLYWTVREWADYLGCSASTVSGLPTWKRLVALRELKKWERIERKSQ